MGKPIRLSPDERRSYIYTIDQAVIGSVGAILAFRIGSEEALLLH